MTTLLEYLQNDENARPDRNGFTPLFRLAYDFKYSYESEEIENIHKQFAQLSFEEISPDEISILCAFLLETDFLKNEEFVSKVLKKWYYKLDDIDKKSELFVILARTKKGLSSNELFDENAIKIKEINNLLWIEAIINSKWFSSLPEEVIEDVGNGFSNLLNNHEFDSEFLSYMSLLSKNVNDKNDIEKFFKIISICLNNCEKESSIKAIENWLMKKGLRLPTSVLKPNKVILPSNQFVGFADLAVSKVKKVATIFEYSPN